MKESHRLSRIIRLGIVILLLSIIIFFSPPNLLQKVHAAGPDAALTVYNLNDVGVGSLRNTIIGAASGSTIVFQSGLSGTITLSSQLIIDKSLKIIGPGAGSLTISGNNQCRIFKITSGEVSISGLTIANGKTVGNNGHYGYDGYGGGGGGGGGAGAGGGGILIYGGTVAIDSVVFTGNSAVGGQGGSGGDGWQTNPSPDGFGGDGGSSDMLPGAAGGQGGNDGFWTGSDAGMTLGYSIMSGNYAGAGGGHGGLPKGSGAPGGDAYYLGGDGGSGGNYGGQPFIWGFAGYGGNGGYGGTGNGGAICITAGNLYISNSAFTNNTAVGGLGGNGGSSNFRTSGPSDGLFFGGHGGDGGTGKGGAIYIGGEVISNAIRYEPETVQIVNSTFSGNVAQGGAGGAAGSGGPAFENGYTGAVYCNGIYNRGTIGVRNVSGDTSLSDGIGMSYTLRGFSAAESTITADSTSVSTDGGTATITVTFKDSARQPVFGEKVTLVAETGSPVISPASASTDINGRAVFKISNTRAETVTLAATDTTTGITANQRLAVAFTPGLTNANTSTVSASPASISANGSDYSVIEVILKDSNNNTVVSGKQLAITQNGSSTIDSVLALTDSEGRAFFVVRSNVPGTVTYTIRNTTDNITLTRKAVVDFTSYVWSVNTLDDYLYPGSLRYAISNAPAGTAITFDSGLAGTIWIQGPLPTISRDLVIDGQNANVTIDGRNIFRIFQVNSGTVSIKNLNIVNGWAAGSDGADGDPGSTNYYGYGFSGDLGGNGIGGGLLITDGTVSIENVNFQSNTADGGNGGKGGDGKGPGAPYDDGGRGGNGGQGLGGAIYLGNGTLSIKYSTFLGNRAYGGNGGNGGNGTGVAGDGGHAGNGCGASIFVNAGTLSVIHSSFVNDNAVGGNGGNGGVGGRNPGGMHGGNAGLARGGGIYLTNGTLTLSDIYFSGENVNSGTIGVGTNGNGQAGSAVGCDIYKQSGTIALSDVTFDAGGNSYFNSAPAAALHSTVAVNSTEVNSGGIAFSTISVILRDANGVPVGSGKSVSLAQGTGRSVISPAVSLTDGNGVATLQVSNIYSETVNYTASDITDGFTLTQSVSVNFLPSDAQLSIFTADPASVTANGTETATITVLQRLVNGDPAPGKTVTLSQGTGQSIISPAASVTTNSSGLAVFTVVNGNAETVTYTAVNTTDGFVVPGSATVSFTPYAWVVTSLQDNNTPGSLRHAINSAPAGSSISFQSGLNGTITLGSSLPSINRDLTIDASGADVTISGNDQYQVFRVDGGTVSIMNLAIAHGRSAGSNGITDWNGGNAGHAYGGGLYVAGGTVTVNNVSFHSNAAIGGRGGNGYSDGAYSSGQYGGRGGDAYGGAIFLNAGTLNVERCPFDANSAVAGNGGNASYSWVSTFGGNGGNSNGGAIFVLSGTLNVSDSQFTDNTVTFGQAGSGINANGTSGRAFYADIFAYGGTCAVSNVSFDSESNTYYNISPADAGQSTVTASSSEVMSDGSKYGTVTVTLNLPNGGPAGSGKTVSLTASSSSYTIVPINNGLTNNNGVATFNVKDTSSGAVTYTAKDVTDNVTVTQTADVTFSPSDPDVSLISADQSSVVANGSDISTITVTLKFANGDPAPGKTVTLSQGSGHSVISPASAISDASGLATFTVTNGYVESVTYNARNVTDSYTLTQTTSVAFTSYDWVVKNLDDTNTFGTLRHAITHAYSGATITFQSDISGTITLQSLLPAINKDLVIDGAGNDVTVSGNNLYRIFRVEGGTLTVKNLSLTNGKYTGITGAANWWNTAGAGEQGAGGAIYITDGTVAIDNVLFNGNRAVGGLGGSSQYGAGGRGGDGLGGAIYLHAGSLTIINSRFENNSASGNAGANGGERGFLEGGIAGNGGNGWGGAIFINTGTLTITGSHFTGNTVAFGLGGIGNGYGGTGGGSNGLAGYADLYVYNGTCAARDTDFGSNSSSTYNSAAAVVSQSMVTASPMSLLSDGVKQSLVKVTLRLADGSQAGSGRAVTLSQGSGHSIILPQNNGLSDGNGAATFIVTNSYAESVTYTARNTTEDFALSEGIAVTFTPSDADLSTASTTAASVVANGSDESVITVTLVFSNGDPAVGKPVILNQGSGHSVILPDAGTTDSNGQATFTVTNGYAETVTYYIEDSNGNTTVSQNVSVTFTPYTWVVTSLDDTNILGTLRHAINRAPSGGEITFQNGLIGTITLGSSMPTISKDLVIDGAGATVTISGSSLYRLFRVDSGTVSFRNLTIADGKQVGSTGSDGGYWVPGGNGESISGGAMFIAGGTVTLENVTFNNNVIVGGNGGSSYYAGGHASNGLGGAIYLQSGLLTISNCRFEGNSAVGGNGGHNTGVSEFGGNGGNGLGGAICLQGGSLTINGSVFDSNTAIGGIGGGSVYRPGHGGSGLGGAIYQMGGSLTINGTTLSSNSATGRNGTNGPNYGFGGNGGNGWGGAVFINAGSVLISDSQFISNSVNFGTGGVGFANASNGSALYADIYNYSGVNGGIRNVTFSSGADSYYGVSYIYTVSYDAQDGSPVSSIDVFSGSLQNEPFTASRLGYVFGGWFRESTCLTVWNFSADTVSADMTLFAKWTAVPTYTVTFKDWDNSLLKTETVNEGSGATTPVNPSRTGYTYTGWDKAYNNISSDLEVIATYSKNSYTITFVDYDGTEIKNQLVEFESAVSAPAEPTRTGYSFAGWSPVLPAVMPASNVTYTAQWTINRYTINFDSAGGSAVAAIVQEFGTSVTVPADPTRAGYAFTGWSPAIPGTMPSENITLLAQWSSNSYNITFDANGGTGGTGPASMEYDSTLIAPTVSREGYSFTGWSPAVPGTVGAGDAVYTAQWSISQYAITFNSNGGTPVDTIMQDYGTTITAPADPTRTGHTFAGWSPILPTTMPAASETHTAQWTINQYTITFDSAGGSSVDAITQDYGTAITAPADPTRTGYTFTGWNPALPSTMPAENNTHTAQWSINQYTITFDSNGGSAVAAITQDYATTVVAPSNPTRTGYTFTGWSPALPATMPAANNTHTAQWSINQYTITFDSAGGTPVSAITQDYATPVTEPANPTRAGYTFAGWLPAIPSTMPATNATHTAQWSINQYTITFESAGGTSVDAITQDYSTTVTSPADPTRTGYTFAGWSPALPSTMPDANITHTAQWTINQYTITFNSAGGSAVATITQDYGTAITTPADSTRTGYTFAGWLPAIPSTMPASNNTHTAQWTINQYTITFDSTGGSTVAVITQDYATAVVAPSKPTKTGYSFTGWSPALLATMPANDVTVTAQWTINQYAITFDSNGGTPVSAITQDYASTVTEPSDPTRTGYTFTGWSPALPATMPTANNIHTAQWTINQYTITFDSAGGSAVDAITQDYATTVVAPADPTRTGYTFTGWSPALPTTMPAANNIHTAQWTINQYTITFDSNGGSAVAAITQDYATAVTAPSDPTRTGYTFAGWSPAVPTTVPASDVTVTAQWTINQYTITFDSAGGTPVAAITQDYSTTVTSPADPTRTGYTFVGWLPTIPSTMPASNNTHTAQWSINQYTITFDSNGGTPVDAITQDYATSITTPTDPTRTGYTFTGWLPAIPSTMPASNNTHTAQWTINQYTITFDSAGGTPVSAITQDYGTPITSPADPTRTGYTFAGWSPALPSTMPAASNTHTAQWTINQYTITFDSNGESAVDAITQDYGTTITAPAEPTRTGYTFAGWSPALPATMPAESITHTAQWSINKYTIAFDSNEGSSVAAITQDYASIVAAPADPTRTGYTFAGWSPALPSTMPAANKTHTAQWTINQYSITFDSAGGTPVTAITQDYATIVAAPADPTRTGYTFKGWSPALPATMPAANNTHTAQWSINQYTITFDSNGGSAVDSITQDYGTAITAPADPTRTGYTFAGWGPALPETMPAENNTHTAQWTINQYTITFDSAGGSTVNAITQDYATAVTAPADPTRTGYTFMGWLPALPSTMPASHVTVTAQWTINQYSITFDSNGGSAVVAITQDYATAVVTPGNPTRTGYTFTGWSPALPATMPAENNTHTAQWSINIYTLKYSAGEHGSIIGNALQTLTYGLNGSEVIVIPDNGYYFVKWSDGSVDNPRVDSNVKYNVNVAANYAAKNFTLTYSAEAHGTILGATAQNVTYGSSGAQVTAVPDAGYHFASWSDGVITATRADSSITDNVSLYARFAANTSTETGAGNVNTATAILTTKASGSGAGAATVNVSAEQASNAINKALEIAAAQGAGTVAIFEIRSETSSDTQKVTTVIPKATVEQTSNSDIGGMRISNGVASITFDNNAISTISGEASGDVTVASSKVEASSLSYEEQLITGNRPIFNFSVTDGTKTISLFNGNVTVSVPYELQEGEDVNAIVIYFINAKGELEIVRNCKYDRSTGTATFVTNHFSRYMVGYNSITFRDVQSTAWYSKAVSFIAAREITLGTGSIKYSPDAKLTRAEVIVMIMRAYGIVPDTEISNNFDDAGNTYYTGYLAAVKRLGISTGVGNNLFAPGRQVSRQEMIVLIYNTLKAINLLPENINGKQLSQFTDADSIAEWAKEGIAYMAEAGVINGNGGKLSPNASATRAELAQLIYNMMQK